MAKQLPVRRYGRVLRIPTPTGLGVGDINTYAILPRDGEPGGPILVDTGVCTKPAWEALSSGLRSHGFEVANIELVLLTHAHPDHFGQAARIQREAGCEVWIHEAGDRSLRRYTEEPRGGALAVAREHMRAWGVPEERTGDFRGPERARDMVEPLVPDRWLRDGEILDLAGFRIRVAHTPGHCPEQVVFLEEGRQLAFSGDHLLPNITPVCLIQFPEKRGQDRIKSLAQYQRSLHKIEPMQTKIVFPSHGDVIRDHHALISGYRMGIEKRARAVVDALARGEATAYELGQKLFKEAIDDQLFLVLSEIVGHLDLLEDSGEVEVRRNGPRQVYRRTAREQFAQAGS